MSASVCRTISSEQDMVDKLLCGVQVLENEIMKPLVQRKLKDVIINRAQCSALVSECRAGLDGISKQLHRVVPVVDHSQQGNRYADERHNQFWLCLYSLAEVGRCLEAGAIYISSCAVPGSHRALLKLNPLTRRSKPSQAGNRSFSLTSSFLLQEFRFCLDVVLVGIQYLCESGRQGKGNPSQPSFEWCAETCSLTTFGLKYRCSRPEQHSLLQASSAELLADEDAVHLREQLKAAATKTRWFSPVTNMVRKNKEIASYLMQLQEISTTADSLPSRFEVNYRDIKEGTCLGSGSSGYVAACKWQDEDVVVKFVRSALESPRNRERFEREVSILASLQHPNTVRIFGFGYKEHTGHGFIVMERMEATLASLIRKNRNGNPVPTPFPLDVNFGVLLQITEGLCCLRERSLMHRDLKPENILVNRPDLKSEPLERFYHVKLGDFGTSKFQLNSHYATPKVGTRSYMAPEILATIKDDELESGTYQGYTWKADVYSFGILCSEILTGELPFSDIYKCSSLLDAIHRGERPPLPDSTPHSLKILIEDCWNTNPEKRPDVWELRERLWKCRAECMPLLQFLKDSKLTPPSSWKGFCARLERLQLKASLPSRRLSLHSRRLSFHSRRLPFWEVSGGTFSLYKAGYSSKTASMAPSVIYKEAAAARGHPQRPLHGFREDQEVREDIARMSPEIARIRDLCTLKGHVESIIRLKNLDVDMIQMSYTV